MFKHPVEVLFMTPKAFDKLVTTSSSSLSAKDKAQIADETASLRALGLIDGNVDLFKQENDLNSGGILAYYDPHDKKVRVKGSELTPDVRVTLAHELTHALQDQYFDLGREDSLPDDAQQAFRSVVEGDAVVVQNAYADTMSKADQDEYNQAESGWLERLLEDPRHPRRPAARALRGRPRLRERAQGPWRRRGHRRGAPPPTGQHRRADGHLPLPRAAVVDDRIDHHDDGRPQARPTATRRSTAATSALSTGTSCWPGGSTSTRP